MSALAPTQLLRRRWDGDFTVDEWGLDADLVHLVSPFLTLRWRIDVEGVAKLPRTGPALVVFNRRVGVSEPIVLARALRQSSGRFVRAAGVPDVAPIGTALRRLGGILDRPDEIAGVLRAGHIVAVPLDRVWRWGSGAGPINPAELAPAIDPDMNVPVFPAAVQGHEAGRRWKVTLGRRCALPAGESPLALAELAETARLDVQKLLER